MMRQSVLKRCLSALLLLAAWWGGAAAQTLPATVCSGLQGSFHVQGIAYDRQRECMYMSFTTSLIKVDMQGRLLASVINLTGHLGCLSLNPDDGRLYGSLEYKHDVIGQGIAKGTAAQNDSSSGFYVAVFDVEKMVRPDMDAAEVMTTVHLAEATDDFNARLTNQGREVEHRYGCSGIDGLTFAPAWGQAGGKMMLYVAYGIYSDHQRTDNDHQVILCYDTADWPRMGRTLDAGHLHRSGPAAPDAKYFVYTGNTTWGIQNLAYDPTTGNLLAAVYGGKKEGWTDFRLYVLDHSAAPVRQTLRGVEPTTEGLTLSLRSCGTPDGRHGVWGWMFPHGSTGLCGLGNGLFYVSHEGKEQGRQYANVRLYRWSERDGMTLVE